MDYLEFIARVTYHIPDKGQVAVSIDDDGQFRHNSSVHLLKRFSLMGNLSQDSHPSGGASHHHVTYPFAHLTMIA
jgi:hypothetical protein